MSSSLPWASRHTEHLQLGSGPGYVKDVIVCRLPLGFLNKLKQEK